MYKPWVILKEFAYMFMALHLSCLDITLNSFLTGNFEVGMSSNEKFNELGVRDDAWWVITFSYPLGNWELMYMSLRKGFVTVVCLLELRV